MRKFLLLMCAVILLSACAPTETPAPTPTPQVVDVYATDSTRPWLPDLFACAAQFDLVLRMVDSPSAAQVRLRLGEPAGLTMPAYQIGSEDVLIVTHRASPVQNLDVEQARALFAGAGSSGVVVWVFAEGEDIRQIFDAAVMNGQLVSSEARLAGSPQEMNDTLLNTPNTVGFLPRRWKAGDARDVFTILAVPVLAITDAPPQGALQGALACMQQKTAP